MSSDADDSLLVEVLGCVFADIRDIGGEFLHSALGLAHLGEILVDMDGSKDVPADHLLREHDGVLVVVALPWKEGHHEVASQREFATLGRVAFCQNLARLDLVALADDRFQGHGRVLVRLAPYRKLVDGLFRGEAYEFLIFGPLIFNPDLVGVDIGDFTFACSLDLGPGVDADPLLESGAHDRGLRLEKRNRLSHHVGSHEGAVCVVMLEERNEGCGHGRHLVRGDVHVVYHFLVYDREVGLETALDAA